MSSAYQLRIHQNGAKHKRVIAAIEAKKNNYYPCSLCNLQFKTLNDAETHKFSRGHQQKERESRNAKYLEKLDQ